MYVPFEPSITSLSDAVRTVVNAASVPSVPSCVPDASVVQLDDGEPGDECRGGGDHAAHRDLVPSEQHGGNCGRGRLAGACEAGGGSEHVGESTPTLAVKF